MPFTCFNLRTMEAERSISFLRTEFSFLPPLSGGTVYSSMFHPDLFQLLKLFYDFFEMHPVRCFDEDVVALLYKRGQDREKAHP